jgi:Na+/proline symporter
MNEVWAGMMFGMLLFWVAVVVLAFAVAAWLFPAASAAPHGTTAREILDARYARGELTPDQYRQMRQELAPEPGRTARTPQALTVVLVLLTLALVAWVAGFGMHGGWFGPGYPGHPGEWPSWMPHMWGR